MGVFVAEDMPASYSQVPRRSGKAAIRHSAIGRLGCHASATRRDMVPHERWDRNLACQERSSARREKF